MTNKLDIMSSRQHYWLDSWNSPSNNEIEKLKQSDEWNKLSDADKKLFNRIYQGRIERNNKPLKCRFKIVYE